MHETVQINIHRAEHILVLNFKHWKCTRLLLSPYSSNTILFSEVFPHILLLMSNNVINKRNSHSQQILAGKSQCFVWFLPARGALNVSPTTETQLTLQQWVALWIFVNAKGRALELHLFWRNRWTKVQAKASVISLEYTGTTDNNWSS